MASEHLNELASDIKATGDDIARDAERVRDIEEEKVSLHPNDPRLIELANESEATTAKMAVKAKIETALVKEAAHHGSPGGDRQ